MRLISQYGESDIPYERIVVELNKKDKTKIIGYGVDGFDGHWTLAKYSTEEKARIVMGMIRNAYKAERKCFCFPRDEEMEV